MPTQRPSSARIRLGVPFVAVLLAAAFIVQPATAASGPYLVKDIKASGSSSPQELVVMDGKVYFSAQGGGKGRELWVSDGTDVGTKRVKDLRPGSAGSHPRDLTVLGGLLLFSADSGNGEGRELYRSDGTNAGTWGVYDINRTGSGGNSDGDSDPFSFFAYNGVAYFSADDGVHGRELWRSKGQFGTTRMVKDIIPGAEGSNPNGFVGLPNVLIFQAESCVNFQCSETLYKTNGTRRGTKPLKDHDGQMVTGAINWPVGAGGKVFFSFDETQLWRSTGKAARTRSLGDIPAWEIVAVGSRVFFRAGEDLWRSDGSDAGTVMIRSFPGAGPPFDLVDMGGGRLFFFSSTEPWTSDGTTAGTQPVGKQVQSDSNFAVLDSVIYFGGWSNGSAAVDPDRLHPNGLIAPTLKLWRSDGTADGTYSVADTPEAHIRWVTAAGDGIFFTADNGPEGTELWRYVP